MKNTKENIITIKKEFSVKKTPVNWILIFLLIIFIVDIMLTAFCFGNIIKTKYEIKEVSDSVMMLKGIGADNGDYVENNIEDYYNKIDQKFDVELDRLLTIVGIFSGIITLFGVLLSFRAPRDIDKRIEEIKHLSKEAKESAENSQYLSDIIEALNIDYDGKITDFKRIENITTVIKDYPDKSDAYMHRGFLYDNYSSDPKFSKEKRIEYLRKAIIDYKIALQLGADEASCYNDIGVAHSKIGEETIAINYYNKAIKDDPDEAIYYSNRADSYCSLEDYEQALADLDKAISLEPKLLKAYICRISTYERMASVTSDLLEKSEFYELAIADLKEIVNIDPKSIDNKNSLMSLYYKLLRINCKLLSTTISDDKAGNYLENLNKYRKKINDLKMDFKSLNTYFDKLEFDVETILNFETPKIINDYTIGDEFITIDYNGEKTNCRTIATFNNESIDKKYVLYTDNSYTDGKLNAYICSYRNREQDGKIVLEHIKDENEMKYVKSIIKKNQINRSDISAKDDNNYDLYRVSKLIGQSISEAVEDYKSGKFSEAEKAFLKLFILYENRASGVNLAYMKRRGEAKLINKNISELLNENSVEGFELMNLALCYVVGFEVERNFDKAVELVLKIEDNFADVVDWWSDKSLVGEEENNLVMLLIMLYNKQKEKSFDESEFNVRVAKARLDGYDIPDKY